MYHDRKFILHLHFVKETVKPFTILFCLFQFLLMRVPISIFTMLNKLVAKFI